MHEFKVGQRIRLVDTGPIGRYDGTTSFEGTITELTSDEGATTYRVKFDDGADEEHLMRDEFEIVTK